MRYQQRTEVVEAVRFPAKEDLGGPDEFYAWMDKHDFEHEGGPGETLVFTNFDGEDCEVQPGDWIIKRASGDFDWVTHEGFMADYRKCAGV